MSIAAKTKPNQKTHEHSIQKSQKVLKPMSIATKTQKNTARQTHQKTHEHSSKNTKKSKNP